jgi:large subunit ribosomal protein L15
MVAPVRHRPGKPFAVNSKPALLDKMYNLFLGPGGDKWLNDEVKWLAVTHKSFDHGRRGFNDRMAYLGMLHIRPVYQQSAALVGF